MTVTCSEFEQRLHESLDVRAAELPADLQAHAVECALCSQLLSDWNRADVAISVWKIVEPLINTSDEILARVRSMGDRELVVSRPVIDLPSRQSAGAIAAVMVAAALLLILSFGWRVSQTATVVRRESTTISVAGKSHSDSKPDLQNLVQDARDAYAALASEAWQQVSATNSLLPPSNVSPRLPDNDSTHPVPDPLSRPLAPIRAELREAWNSLMDRVFSNSQDSST